MRTQVAIIGAGPSGLMLSHILNLAGVESIVLERGDRDHVGTRMRAGGLEDGTTDLLRGVGLNERLDEIGIPLNSTDFRFGNAAHRIDYASLTGSQYTIYPQYEIVSDLIDARTDSQGPLLFGATVTDVEGLDGDKPLVRFIDADGNPDVVECDFVAGCDGFLGVSRNAIPADARKIHEEIYPFAWLGILAEAPPPSYEVAFSCHDNGFAMSTFRAPTVTRMYLQCSRDEKLEDWSDDRIWSELHTRLDVPDRPAVNDGPIVQRSITSMKSVITEPMRYGPLFLVGDAAHIVPPTGAKGLNAALADAGILGRALATFYRKGDSALIDRYSEECLKRNWSVQRFAASLCIMFHRFPGASDFMYRLQRSHMEYMTQTEVGRRWFAEGLVGLPIVEGGIERLSESWL